MASTTKNLNLVLPSYDDKADVMVLNSNFQKVDDAFESGGVVGPQGPSGYTPQRGVDYWTEADIQEIKGYVDDAILNGAW
ncbi:MAG: hypothetical protein J6W00_15470 [Lentisphaeria bacterium]|nr:hypothetical protein [Lentisphaeria bacterium]